MRQFKDKKGIRDVSNGKISYFGFRHPLCEHSFGKYMLKHRRCADGTLRDANNWWSVWEEEVSIDSMTRHVVDLEALEAGLYVYKARYIDEEGEEAEETHVFPYSFEETFNEPLPENWEIVSKEDCYNAIRFNATAGLLKLLRK